MHSRGCRISHPQRNAMGQSTEMSLLVSMFFLDILKSLEILMEVLNILVFIIILSTECLRISSA